MDRNLYPIQGSAFPGLVLVGGKVTTGSGGAIASSDFRGGTIVKTASEVGRYTITVTGNAPKFLGLVGVTVIGPDDTAISNTAGGSGPTQARDNDIGTGAQDGTVEVQFTRNDTSADAELPDNTVFTVWVLVANTTV
jgi:hypothetical protein